MRKDSLLDKYLVTVHPLNWGLFNTPGTPGSIFSKVIGFPERGLAKQKQYSCGSNLVEGATFPVCL